MANAFSLIFGAAVALMCLLRFWLAGRQIGHVLAHRGSVPPSFAGRIDLAAHQKAADYTVARTRFGRFALAVEIAALLMLTLGGSVQAIHAFWSAHLEGLAYGVALIFSVLFVSAVVDLPLAVYRQFVIEERFGFNRMSARLFVADLARQAVLAIVVGGPALLAVLWLMNEAGRLWWFAVWLFWCAFNLLLLFVYPTWIAPLFNRFVPLDDIALQARIEALLARCGFASSGVLVMDGSKRSTHGNAYFTGYGRTKRIVFFDTLLGRLQPAETEAVLAHELGHFRHHHVTRRIALAFVLSLLFLAILGQLVDAGWFYRGLGVAAQNAAIGLVLFLLAGPVFIFLLTPLLSLLSRRDEFEADRYAAAQTSADDLVSALVKLYEDNATTLTPDPVYSLFYDSHPPAALRVARLQEAG
ncbi:M48 family metallopeptidase [Accumulibacter sp.]|uniref:M48 family metallopeptidase n=1 Tax=Accumulibacter sp. TaxID=2053492 RepID=UPI0025E48B4E|nr:M48 family metallopeptidase [Accumulibacter sp.]MCM8594533.1 M48 family metallopeptidase [Accumulibacter sp.]MCM8627381.1 M48 family metallopeptidase [Accumulibacter sp.]MDS4048679.1 M48 family metallopeptidase [Accumulibacter sp.]